MSQFWIEHGDAVEALKLIPSGSVDALVTDPPAGIGFMGKEWDDFRRQRNPNDAGRNSVMGRISRSGPEYGRRDRQHFIEYLAGILAECRRAMKPGAYGWVWAIPRTAHWTATACEDAGFAVRDVLVHVFGTGFPKSRALLKPASEHWILIKAPGELQELRIEENKIGTEKRVPGSLPQQNHGTNGAWGFNAKSADDDGQNPNLGRWPANFALSHSDECELVGTRQVKGDKRLPQGGKREGGFADVGADKGDGKPCGPLYGDSEVENYCCADDCPVKMLDEQSGITKSSASGYNWGKSKQDNTTHVIKNIKSGIHFGDSGGASRFFYQAKPSTKERSAGLPDGSRNTHTTVKSIVLMRHLISLIAAPGATVLDPFTGSGSTGIASLKQGCRFIGIEREAEYVEIARQRVYAASQKGTPE